MSYVKTEDVQSPKKWLLKRIPHDGGELKATQTKESNRSAADGRWTGDGGSYDFLAIPWNGCDRGIRRPVEWERAGEDL